MYIYILFIYAFSYVLVCVERYKRERVKRCELSAHCGSKCIKDAHQFRSRPPRRDSRVQNASNVMRRRRKSVIKINREKMKKIVRVSQSVAFRE